MEPKKSGAALPSMGYKFGDIREKEDTMAAKAKLEEFKTYITIPIIVAHPITKDMRGFYMLISKGK